jgi:hypothetical protein
MIALRKLISFSRKSPREKLRVVRNRLIDWRIDWKVPRLGDDRTIYLIGLYGSGRWYFNDLITQNIGQRARYFRDVGDRIRLHPGPTSMIYSGHATMKHISLGQAPPALMNEILNAVKSEFADLIFVYRHPLDALLSNWIWWRGIRNNNRIGDYAISQAYKNIDDLCADLDRNFCDFKAFAGGDPEFWPGAWTHGSRFLSFVEFVEETELHLRSATLALRLEDFMIDSLNGLSKIVNLMSVDLDSNGLHVAPPRTKPYRYLAVKGKVPRFKTFIEGLDAETEQRIKKIGYMDA